MTTSKMCDDWPVPAPDVTEISMVKQKEKFRLIAAVNDFAEAMKERLLQKLDQGYVGWDGDYPLQELCNEICADASAIADFKADYKAAVDIGNRAMMLFKRMIMFPKPIDSAPAPKVTDAPDASVSFYPAWVAIHTLCCEIGMKHDFNSSQDNIIAFIRTLAQRADKSKSAQSPFLSNAINELNTANTDNQGLATRKGNDAK